ncbi:MAG: hypothetical protein GX853_09600 [Chloroflexi bacterium]|nr:hypothetical protein [Chloroflexota bacterium]
MIKNNQDLKNELDKIREKALVDLRSVVENMELSDWSDHEVNGIQELIQRIENAFSQSKNEFYD